jgi:hypothetical protein
MLDLPWKLVSFRHFKDIILCLLWNSGLMILSKHDRNIYEYCMFEHVHFIFSQVIWPKMTQRSAISWAERLRINGILATRFYCRLTSPVAQEFIDFKFKTHTPNKEISVVPDVSMV